MMEYLFSTMLAVIELTNILLCYSEVLRVKITTEKKKIVIWYVGIVLINMMCIYGRWDIPISVINMIYGFATIWCVVDEKKIHAIRLYLCAYTMESVAALTSAYLYAIALNVSQALVERTMVFSILINSVFGIIMIIKKVINSNLKKRVDEYTFHNNVYMALTLGSTGFLFILSAISSFSRNFEIPYKQTNLLGMLLCGMCIIFYVLFLWLAKTIYKNESYQREKDMMNMYMLEQDKYIRLVVEKDTDMRGFRHDLKEQMSVIARYLSTKDYDGANIYIEKLFRHYNDATIEKYTGNAAVDAIISQKKKIMDEKHIEFVWNGSDMNTPDKIEIYDICTIFINILNNAIEACEKLEKKDKRVDIKTRINGDNMYIMERNRVINKVQFDDEGNPISSKADKNNHGYGCKNIKNTVKKYDGVVTYEEKNGIFTLEIKI